jgi:hypothetical protein
MTSGYTSMHTSTRGRPTGGGTSSLGRGREAPVEDGAGGVKWRPGRATLATRGSKRPWPGMDPTVTDKISDPTTPKHAAYIDNGQTNDDLRDRRPRPKMAATKRGWGRPRTKSDSSTGLPMGRLDGATVTRSRSAHKRCSPDEERGGDYR